MAPIPGSLNQEFGDVGAAEARGLGRLWPRRSQLAPLAVGLMLCSLHPHFWRDAASRALQREPRVAEFPDLPSLPSPIS